MAHFLTTKKLHYAIIGVGLFLLPFSSIYGVNNNIQKILTNESSEDESSPIDLTGRIRLGGPIFTTDDNGNSVETRYFKDPDRDRMVIAYKPEHSTLII